jgi:hypothetical protein
MRSNFKFLTMKPGNSFASLRLYHAAIQLSGKGEKNISKRNYEITVVQDIHIYRLELQRLSLLFPFLKYLTGIWDWGLAYSFWDHVIQISVRHMTIQYIFSELQKIEIFCGNIYSQ